MKKSVRTLLLASLTFLAAAPAFAETKIGFINMEQILTKSVPMERAQKKLAKEFEKREAELNTLGTRLRDMQVALEKNDVTMSEADRRVKEREWNSLNSEFQRKRREYTEDLNQRRAEELKVVRDRFVQIVKQIGDSGKYDLIVEDAIYHSEAVDITPQVMKALSDVK